MIEYVLLGTIILFFLASVFDTIFGSFFKKPKLRGHKNKLQYYDDILNSWYGVYGYYDEKNYGSLPCTSKEELERYRQRWKTLHQLKHYMTQQDIRHNRELEERKRKRDNDIY